MKNILEILTCTAVILAIFSGCGKKPEMKKTHLNIVFYGDSVTNGYGIKDTSRSFYGRIEAIMKAGVYDDVTTYNAGVNGDDTSEASARIVEVKALKPDIVVIAFGLNDCQNERITLQDFRQNLLRMSYSFPSETRIVYATSNTFMDTGQELLKKLNKSLDLYMEEMRKIAREKDYPLIDIHEAWKKQIRYDSRHIESLYIDPSHPSEKGHDLFFRMYMDVLRKLIVL